MSQNNTSYNCRFCQSELKESFADLGQTPVSNAYLEAQDLDIPANTEAMQSQLELSHEFQSGFQEQFIDVEHFEMTLDEAMRQYERHLLKMLYPKFPSSRQLGKKLGVSHTAVANKLKAYGINKKS